MNLFIIITLAVGLFIGLRFLRKIFSVVTKPVRWLIRIGLIATVLIILGLVAHVI